MKMAFKFVLVVAIFLCCGPAVVVGGNDEASGEPFLDIYTSEVENDSLDNITLTCAEMTTASSGTSHYSPNVIKIVRGLRITIFTPIAISAICLNSFVVYVVAKNKKLHTLSFGIALQVNIMDIIVAVTDVAIIANSIADEWVFGSISCVAIGFVSFTFAIIRTCIMFVFVADRFFSVFFPYSYPKFKVKMAVSLSVFSWILIIVAQTLAFPGILDCYSFLPSVGTCGFTASCNNTCSAFSSIYLGLVALPSTILPVIMYTALYIKARLLQKQTPTIQIGADNSVAEEGRRRERRATVTYFLLFVTLFALTTPPALTLAVIDRVYPSAEQVPSGLFIAQAVAIALSGLFVVTDPIVIMRHSDVREVLSEMKARIIDRAKVLRLNEDEA